MRSSLTARNSKALQGEVRVPGDKSISHRALILGGLSIGTTSITGLLEGEDVLATAAAIRSLGADVTHEGPGNWRINGRGVGGLAQAPGKLDFGNSGTGARLMMGVIAGQDVSAEFVGDASLSRRPMGRVLNPLREMGLQVEQDKDTLPITLSGTPDLVPITYEMPVPSAQVKSAILLAGLHAPGITTVLEREATRDHTERMLRHFGAQVDVKPDGNVTAVSVHGHAELIGADVAVPGDPSSAAFLAAAALVCEGSQIVIKDVLVNPTRTGFYETLKEMGADLVIENQRDESGEPVADIRVTHSQLKGTTVPASRAPSMIDEYPILAVVAAFADGETRMEGLKELRVKESDRLAATLAGLEACGVTSEAGDDWLCVTGTGSVAGGGEVVTHMDHRIAMAFVILGLGAKEPVSVDDAEIINTSFPEFTDLMSSLGAQIEASGG